MAYKTPGVYFNEEDNTDFTNPAASINTTVAIIGFAKKGPIGIPTEIYTMNDYKNIFGSPISGQYAGLAVRSVLSAGGVVLYTRIADETIATKSNVILKNGSSAIDGAVVINKAGDINVGTDGYELGKSYAGAIVSSSGIEKTLFIKTPPEGRLKLSNMLKQFKESLGDTYGFESFEVPRKIRNTSVRSFNITAKNENTTIESGPYFVSVKGTDTSSGSISTLISNINSALEAGTNCYQKIYVFGGKKDATGNVDIFSRNSGDSNLKLCIGNEQKKVFTFDYKIGNGNQITKRIEIQGVQEESTYYIYMKDLADALTEAFAKEGIYVKWCFNNEDAGLKDSSNEYANQPYLLFVSLSKDQKIEILPKFDSSKNIKENSLFVPVEIDSIENEPLYFYNNENAIDPYYKSEHYEFVKLKPTNSATLENQIYEFENISYKFKNEEIGYIQKTEMLDDNGQIIEEQARDENDQLLFDDNDSSQPIMVPVMTNYGSDINSFNGLFVCKQKCVEKNIIDKIADVSYNDDTTELIFTATKFNEATGTEVELSTTEFGGYLFYNDEINKSTTESDDIDYLKAENENSVDATNSTVYNGPTKFVGEAASTMSVYIDNNQIKFFENGNITPGSIKTKISELAEGKLTSNTYGDLEDLVGTPMNESDFVTSGFTNAYKCVVYKEGSAELDPSKRDVIVFTAREYGEGTNTGIRIYTSVSPIDGTKTHYIETVVNGITKETWEDVSYNPSSERYFVNLINEEPENSGSAYIKVDVVKNDTTQEEVMVPDTSTITGSDAPIYIGKPINETSINRAATEGKDNEGNLTGKPVAITDYLSYDYNIGDNGVPDDSTDLFNEAMDTLNSGLSNKDLYAWHILITPDNISEDVQDCAIKLCEFMEDAIYIADPPQGISRKNVVKWHNGAFGRGSALQSDYACTYWPWLKVYDSNESKYVWCMPSVLMAAQFCKVDKNYDPWYAPAGQTNGLISQAVDIETYPNKADRDEMYLDQNRVNPFLMQKNGNIIAYGEKTLKRKNSTLTKIHTRRMLIALKHELRNSVKGFIFMPTVADNMSKIRSIATSIMEKAAAGGGVSSYKVICDESNNTIETLQQDILNIDIVCVPNGCIEQVNINFVLNKSAS